MNARRLLLSVMQPFYHKLTRFILKQHYKGEKRLSGTRSAKRVLIVAPHVDDETIGAGGTLKKHALEGTDIACVYITDGASSKSHLPRDELIAARKKEAKQVQHVLGISALYFLDLPDQKAESDDASQVKLAQILEQFGPDLIYCPPFVDCHPDHIATGRLLAAALERTNRRDATIRLYEINCPIPPEEINCVVDVTDTFADKLRAVAIFQSQTLAFDGFLELNHVKAEMVRKRHADVRQVEAFIEMTADAFVEQFERLDGLDHPPYAHLFVQATRRNRLLSAIYKNLRLKRAIYKQRHL